MYNLDSPIASQTPQHFIPQCTSSPLSNQKGQTTSSQTQGHPTEQNSVNNRKVEASSASACQSFDSPYGKVKEPLYCQSAGPLICPTKDSNRTLIKMSSNSSEKSRAMSSDNILDSESGYGSATQGYQVLKEDYNIHVVQSNIETKRTRLRKSVSSDGLLSGTASTSEVIRSENIYGESDKDIDIIDRSVSILGADHGPSETELPELAPVTTNKSRGRKKVASESSELTTAILDETPKKVDNGAYSQIESDQVLQNIQPAIGLDTNENIELKKDAGSEDDADEFVNAETSMRRKLSSSAGSPGSIHETAETVNLENTWTESQVTVLSKQSPKSGDEKLSQSSLATSIERTESISSETLCREEMDAKVVRDPLVINLDKQPYQELLTKCELTEGGKNTLSVCLDSAKQGDQLKLKNNKSFGDQNICRSDSGNSCSGKTNETSTSDEFYTALEYSSKSSKGELDASLLGSKCLSPSKVLTEDIAKQKDCKLYDENPPVPLISAELSDIILSEPSDFNYFIPEVEEQSKRFSNPLVDTSLNIEPLMLHTSLCDLKSPASESSSSSGSYSVTTDSGPNNPALVNVSQAEKTPLIMMKDFKQEADVLMKEVMPGKCDEAEQKKPNGDCSRKMSEISNPELPKAVIQEDWTDVERTQRKQCMKLNLPHDIISDISDTVNKSEMMVKENIGSIKTNEVSTSDNIELLQSEGNQYAKDGSKSTKTPSSIPRGILEDSFTQSPTLARSPAMHEGFHLKDWKVERTPINTPDASVLTSRLPQLSDEDEEIESESLNSETDPISKGSGTSSFLPSSIDASESRATSSIADKDSIHPLCGEEKTNTMFLGPKREKEEKNKTDMNSATIQNEDSFIPTLVKPPAGFTDSPVKSTPETFSIKSIVENELEDNQEILVLGDSDVQKPQVHEVYNISTTKSEVISELEMTASENVDSPMLAQDAAGPDNHPKKDSYQHPELVVCQRHEVSEVMTATIPEDKTRKSSSSTGTGSRASSRARQKSRSRSRSKSSERMLQNMSPSECDIDEGVYRIILVSSRKCFSI